MTPTATAKDAIIVGAVNSDNNSMTDFSSWGPTDDGRIKPDLVAPGCQYVPDGLDDGIVSTFPGDTYTARCGTSMATPVVAGSISLMLQYWRQTHTGQPNILPSTIKAILIQTAKDLGNTGPDYSFGYGLIDVNEAVKLIGADDANNNVIMQDLIDDQNDKDLFNVDVPAGQNKLKITLVWDDEPAAPNPSRALVNNLDLVVREPNGTRHYPWTLDPTAGHEGDPAVRTQADNLNNVEQVEVDNPASGLWSVEVNGPNVPAAPQSYSLVMGSSLSRADFNGDKIVNFFDYAELASAWQTGSGHPDYNDIYDVNDNNSIDNNDLAVVCLDWLWQPGLIETQMMMGQSLGFTEGLETAAPAGQPIDTEALIEQFEEFLADEQIREHINEDDLQKLQKLIDFLKEQLQD